MKPFGITKVIATTLQAISGAGYPGVPSMDINANVIPFIGGEEAKMEEETQKILGAFAGDHIEPLAAKVSAHCNRVPVVDGHTVTISVELSTKPTEADIRNAFDKFSSVPQERNLPSAPKRPVIYMSEPDRPQPRKDTERENGMAVFLGRLRPCPVLDYKFVALGHNTVRGAAGRRHPERRVDVLGGLARLMIVMKFGGTSVESATAIGRVASIVKARVAQHPVVVVSAMGKTTNKLLAIAAAAIGGKREDYLQQLHALRDFHSHEARQVVPLAARAELDRTLDDHFQELTELVKGLAVLGELTPRSIDAISSYGERLSSYIVTLAFRHFGMDAPHVDSRKLIVTDNRHTQAAPLFAETYARLAKTIPPIAEKHVVVMGGFIASTETGVTTTLGRGGSDYTASIVGAGIGAEEIQIWTDVDGMLTADPTILPGGHRVKTISFAEAAELAYFGAKVLHPATVVPAIEKNIPVLILNSRRPDVPGTRIVSEPVRCGNVVKSIACKRKITVVNIHSTRMLMAHGFLRRIFEIFDRHETSVDMVATSGGQRLAHHRQHKAAPGHLRGAAPVRRRLGRGRPGHRLPGRRKYPLHSGRGGPGFRRAQRNQYPDDLARRFAVESQPGRRRAGSGESRRRTASRILHEARRERLRGRREMNIALIGYGKMGKLIEQLASAQGDSVVLTLDEFNNAAFEGITDANFLGVDVAIDFSIPAAAVENIERISALGVNLVVGTTGWFEHLDHVRAVVEKNGTGLVWSPNFSIGVNAFFRLVSEAARLLANESAYEAWAYEIHHSAKKDAPSGTLWKLVEEMKAAGYSRKHRRQLEPRRRAPRHARDRFRFRRRHHHAAPRRPQPGRIRARRPACGKMVGRQEGLLRIRRYCI